MSLFVFRALVVVSVLFRHFYLCCTKKIFFNTSCVKFKPQRRGAGPALYILSLSTPLNPSLLPPLTNVVANISVFGKAFGCCCCYHTYTHIRSNTVHIIRMANNYERRICSANYYETFTICT